MTIPNVLKLPRLWKDCPKFWQNFVNNNFINGEKDSVYFIISRDYGAMKLYDTRSEDGDLYIVFPDEQTKFEFILEWS